MTPPTQDDLAAGRELDALVGLKVMGLRADLRTARHLVAGYDDPEGWGDSDSIWDPVPAYSTDIGAAWLVLDEMVWRVGTANIRIDMEDYGRGAGTAKRAERAVWVTIGEYTEVGPAPLAICKAALMAMSSGKFRGAGLVRAGPVSSNLHVGARARKKIAR